MATMSRELGGCFVGGRLGLGRWVAVSAICTWFDWCTSLEMNMLVRIFYDSVSLKIILCSSTLLVFCCRFYIIKLPMQGESNRLFEKHVH